MTKNNRRKVIKGSKRHQCLYHLKRIKNILNRQTREEIRESKKPSHIEKYKALTGKRLFSKLKHHLNKNMNNVEKAILVCDPDQSGFIIPERLKSILSVFCFPLSEEQFKEIEAKLRVFRNRINYLEFLVKFKKDHDEDTKRRTKIVDKLVHYKSKCPPDLLVTEVEELLRDCIQARKTAILKDFKVLDVCNVGVALKNDFRKILAKFAFRLTDKQFEALWETFPRNKYNQLFYDKFVEKYSSPVEDETKPDPKDAEKQEKKVSFQETGGTLAREGGEKGMLFKCTEKRKTAKIKINLYHQPPAIPGSPIQQQYPSHQSYGSQSPRYPIIDFSTSRNMLSTAVSASSSSTPVVAVPPMSSSGVCKIGQPQTNALSVNRMNSGSNKTSQYSLPQSQQHYYPFGQQKFGHVQSNTVRPPQVLFPNVHPQTAASNFRNNGSHQYKAPSSHGITQTNELVNLNDFFSGHILPILQSQAIDEFPILKADCIRYYLIFLNQLPKELVLSTLPSIINLLTAKNTVVHTYAALAVERVFTMKGDSGSACFKGTDLQPVAQLLLYNLFQAFEHPGSSENEYVMKAIMRTFSILQDNIVPYLGDLLPKMTLKLSQVSKNPSKLHFNHCLFETFSLAVRIACRNNKSAVLSFEEALLPVFENILQQDIQEFVPYVFQLLSLFLEFQDSPVPEHYMALFPCLLVPVLWERLGNVPALSRLLQAYLAKGAQQIVATGKLTAVLVVFQKLMASKTNDHEGFYILHRMIENIPMETFNEYLKNIFLVLFHRLQHSKTTKFIKCFLVFFFLFSYKYSPQALISLIDSIQTKMFGMIIECVIIPDLKKVSGSIERKICSVGLIKLLTEVCEVTDGCYSQYWTPLLVALIGLFELPEDDSIPEDEHFIEVEETAGYQNAFCQLVFAGKSKFDPINGAIPDARLHLAQCLHKLSINNPGKYPSLISSNVSPEAAAHLIKYLQAANVSLS